MCIKVRPHAAWIGQCRRIKAIGTGVLWPDYKCPQHGRLREFFRWPKVGGGKTEDGAHLWSQFSRMPRGTGKKQASPRGYARLSAALSHGSGGSRNFKKSGWSWSGPTEISKNTCICQSEKPCCNWQIWRTDWEGESL